MVPICSISGPASYDASRSSQTHTIDAVKGRTDVTVGGAWSLDEFEAEVEQSFLVLRERVSVSVGNQFRLEDGSVVAKGVFNEAGVGELSADKVPELREETTI